MVPKKKNQVGVDIHYCYNFGTTKSTKVTDKKRKKMKNTTKMQNYLTVVTISNNRQAAVAATILLKFPNSFSAELHSTIICPTNIQQFSLLEK